MLYVLLLAPYMQYIPMTALSALLIHTAYRMSHYKQFLRVIRIAPRSDVVVLLVCFSLTIFVDMVAGVGVGVVCAAFLIIQRLSDLTSYDVEQASEQNESRAMTLPEGVMLYRIQGPLFFGTIEKAFDQTHFMHDHIHTLILDMSGVPFADITGLVAIKSMLRSIATPTRRILILCTEPKLRAQIEQKIAGEPVEKSVEFIPSVADYIQSSMRK
jgi:SulP family sulfate permease